MLSAAMPTPFFMVGSGRCGSTWLYSVLRHHPAMALTNEAKVLDFLYFCVELAAVAADETREFFTNQTVRMRGLVGRDYTEAWSAAVSRHAKAICEDFYATVFAGRPYRVWGDKLPDPRAAVMARWVWPAARYLVLVRDPRDVLCSWRAFARRAAVARTDPKLVGLTAEALANSWQRLYSGVLEQLDAPLVQRYEDLRREPRRYIGDILAHVGLEWTAEVERALPAAETFASHGTSASPEATIGRWRGELAPEDVRTVEATCGELMRRFDYPLSP
jgi:hypothetical protein